MKWIFQSLISTSAFYILITMIHHSAYAQSKGTDVVATIGTKKITLDDFNKKYKEITAQVLTNPPSKKLFLEDLVRYEVGLQEAKKRGFEKDPIVLEKFNQEMYKALLEKELGSKVENSKISDAEMKTWYTKNPQIRISDILIEVKVGATLEQKAEALKRAQEILEEVKKSNRPFEELVRLYSDDLTTKNLGGDIGWQSKVTLMTNYYDAANALKVGEFTKNIVETAFGFHILKLTGRRNYDEANKREIRMAVFDEKRKVIFDAFFNNLKKQYKITTDAKSLE